jgi:hypothetical protein
VKRDLKSRWGGPGKFVIIAVVAALVGAAIGVGLAELTRSGDTTSTVTTAAPVPQAQAPPTTQPVAPPPPPPTQTQTQTTSTPARLVGPVPRVAFASATISPSTAPTQALVTVEVTVTNRYTRALPLDPPVLISDADKVPLDSAAKDAAGPLLSTLDTKASATGQLRFTLPTPVAQRLLATPRAQLQIAGRTVMLKLTPTG